MSRHQKVVSLCKIIQDSLRFLIPRFLSQIPGTRFYLSCSDCDNYRDSGFLELNFGFQPGYVNSTDKNFPEFRKQDIHSIGEK